MKIALSAVGDRGNQQFEYGKRKGEVKSPLRTHKRGINLPYENATHLYSFLI
jgi:hypothetical protein